jgi:NhaA family Na+:H+ antiporter
VHPTLAGVVVGLLTPARAWFGGSGFLASAEVNLQSLRGKAEEDEHELLADLDEIDGARREAVSPVVRLIHALHGWVAFGIMPLFALANAGVTLGSATFAGDGLRVFLGVTLGLVLGKPLGVVGLSWLAWRLRLVALPKGTRWPQMLVVGLAAGIGFTMALFIAQLAFPPGPMLETAKLAILVGSVVGGMAAYAAGRRILAGTPGTGGAANEVEAESSTSA